MSSIPVPDYKATALEEAYTSYLLEIVFDLDGAVTEIQISGREAVTFLSKSGVHRLILRNLWTTVDPHSVGSLQYRHQFSTLLRCVALAQYPKKDTLLDQALQEAYHQQLSPVAAIRSCLQDTAQRTDIPLASFDGIPVPDKSTLKPYLKEEEADETEEDDFGDFSTAAPQTTTHMGQHQQPGWGAFEASTPGMQPQQSSQPQNMGTAMSLQQPQVTSSMNFMPQQQQMSNFGATTQPFQMSQQQQQQQPQLMPQSSTGLISQQPTPPVSQTLSDWGTFGAPAVSQPPQTSAAMTNPVNDEFGGFASATPAEPSGWDALDALAASTPVAPPPTLPDPSAIPAADQPSTEASNEVTLPDPVTTEMQPPVPADNDDFGDFASSESVPPPTQASSEPLQPQSSGWDALDALAATTPAQDPPTLPSQNQIDQSSVEGKGDDFGAFASSSPEMPNVQPQQSQSSDWSSAGGANQTLPSTSGSFEGYSQSSQPTPVQAASGWDALDALADPPPPPPTLPDPNSASPVVEDTVAAPITDEGEDDDFGDFASSEPQQQQASSSGWDALDALAGSTELPPPTLAALPDPSHGIAEQSLAAGSQESLDDSAMVSNTVDMQISDDTTKIQEVSEEGLQDNGATAEENGGGFGDFASADTIEASPAKEMQSSSGFDAFNTIAPTSSAMEGVTAVDEDFGDFESTPVDVQNQPHSDTQLFPVQNPSEKVDPALPMSDVSNGTPQIPEKKPMSASRSDSAFFSARASSVQSDVSSLDDFVDALQGDDQPVPEVSDTNQNYPNSENIQGGQFGASSDDPFSAFETLAPSQPELPPLSSFGSPDSIEQPLGQGGSQGEVQDEMPIGNAEDEGQGATQENNLQDFDESFGDFEGVSADTGDAVPVGNELPSTTATGDAEAVVQPAIGESVTKDDALDADFFGSSATPQVQETVSTAPNEGDLFHSMATGSVDGKKEEFDAFDTVESGIISHNVSEEQGSKAKSVDEMEDFGDFGTAPTVDDFGDFDSVPAAPAPVDDFGDFDSTPALSTPVDDFGAFGATLPSSQPNDNFGAFDSAAPAGKVAAAEDDFGNFDSAPTASEPLDDFGAFDTAPATSMPVDDFGDFAGFGTNENDALETNNEEKSSDGRMAEFDAVPIRKALSDDEGDWGAFKEATQTSAPAGVNPQAKTLLETRDAILAASAHVPESLRQCLGTSAGHVDFENCFEANIGVEVPVSPDRQQRMERCHRIVKMLSSDRSKLASAYWTAALVTATDELSFAFRLCKEANSLSKNERKLVEQKFGTYISGVGEIVRVVRMIVATIGDMLMLDPSSLFTVDTFASSWCSLAVLKDALEIERMWKSISDEASKFGLPKSALPVVSTISELRALSSNSTDATSAPDQLCQFTLQPFVHGSKTSVQVKWGERYFMACAANFLANKCAFFSPED